MNDHKTIINAYIDDELTERQYQELVAWMRQVPGNVDDFITECYLHSQLQDIFREGQIAVDVNALLVSDAARPSPLCPVVSTPSTGHPVVAAPALGFLGNTLHGAVGYFSSGWPVAYLVATVIFGLGLLAGAIVHVSRPLQVATQAPPVTKGQTLSERGIEFVGRITDMVNCQWADPATEAISGAHVPLGRKYALDSGLMEITYNTGAKVILQGPCTYEVESKDGGFLSIGKLTARLEKRGDRGMKDQQGSQSTEYGVRGRDWTATDSDVLRTPYSVLPAGPSPLFAVRTPTAIVTDLGTEFGVDVSEEGNTTSHVFRGSVRLQATSHDGKAEGAAKILHENESACVDSKGGAPVVMLGSSAQPIAFVRELPTRSIKTLDLVDVVAGGNGFGNARGRGINPTNGEIATQPQPRNPDWKQVRDNGRYHRVEGAPYIDGVFVPDDRRGPVQLDSAGHTFANFKTSDERIFSYIWAGGELQTPLPPATGTTIAGIDYASPGHGVLGMVANKGITYDLEAIRRANPGGNILRFRAIVGSMTVRTWKCDWCSADVWVFVDGARCFSRLNMNTSNGIDWFPVSVPLSDTDRFLTLVVTDAGNTIDADRIIFGDPRLELAVASDPKPTTPQAANQ